MPSKNAGTPEPVVPEVVDEAKTVEYERGYAEGSAAATDSLVRHFNSILDGNPPEDMQSPIDFDEVRRRIWLLVLLSRAIGSHQA